MAKKISQLTDGSIGQSGDELEANRGGNSRKVLFPSGSFKNGDTIGAASSVVGNIPSFADATGKLLQDSGIEAARINKALNLIGRNNSGSLISKGKAVKIVSLDGVLPVIELAIATSISDARTVFGITKEDIADTNTGEVAILDNITTLDTSMFNENDILYLSAETAGELTSTPPHAPNYIVSLAYVSVASPTGVIGVRVAGFTESDTSTNLQGILNGMTTQSPQVDFSVSGGVIYADVTNEEDPTSDLPFLIGDDRYLLNTTSGSGTGGAARVVIPPGADSVTLQDSFIYIYLNAGIPTLAAATTKPSIAYSPIADVSAFDAATTLANGEKPFKYRRSNDAIDLINGTNDGGIGLIRDILNAIREKLGTNWDSGQEGTPTINNTTIRLALTAGTGRQFRKANIPLFDGLNYNIYNDSANSVTYQPSINLTDITTDANGNSLLSNNTFYTIRLFYQLNSNGIGNRVIATRPLGSYSLLEEAIQDGSNFTVNVNDTSIEDVIYPIYDIVISRTGSGGSTITLGKLTDLKTRLPNRIGGGGASGGAGADEKVRVSATDTTTDFLYPKLTPADEFKKEITNSGSNETITWKFKGWIYNLARTFKAIFDTESLGADRTFIFPDISGLIAVFGMPNTFKFGGQAYSEEHIETWSAAVTFNRDNGNYQSSVVTSNSIVSQTQKKLGSSYTDDLKGNGVGTFTVTLDSTYGDIDGNGESNPFDVAPTDRYIISSLHSSNGTITIITKKA